MQSLSIVKTDNNPQPAPLAWGVGTAGTPGNMSAEPWASQICHEFAFDVLIVHFKGCSGPAKLADALAWIGSMDDFCSANRLTWCLNLENPNFEPAYVDELGRDWYNRADGRHFFLFPDEMLRRLGNCRALRGLLYDEAEHMQSSANAHARLQAGHAPWVYRPQGESLVEASARFESAIEEVRRHHEAYGLALYTEHVWPVMIHSFAKAGWQPILKVLKETISPVPMACALGSLLQYGCELAACVDLWGSTDRSASPVWTGRETYPGHGPQAYRDALVYAYHMGAGMMYTENLAYEHPDDPIGSLIQLSGEAHRLTPLGEMALAFIHDYVPQHSRYYDPRTIRPRVAIIRQEDGCFGQDASPWYPDALFGHREWKTDPSTRAWIDTWHLLTLGGVRTDGLSWGVGGGYASAPARVGEPFRFLVPVDGVVVFDQRVTGDLLSGVEVIVLTGLAMPVETQEAVRACVQAGATAIALPHLAPAAIGNVAGDAVTGVDGAGRWILSDDFLHPLVRQALEPVLPPEDTIRYRFGETEVVMTNLAGGLLVRTFCCSETKEESRHVQTV